MKLVQSLIVAALVAVPVASFAQSNQPVTRAEVRAELVQLQKAGYQPGGDSTQYPQNIEAALARVHAQNGADAAAYGGAPTHSVESGSRSTVSHAPVAEQDVIGLGSIYAHS